MRVGVPKETAPGERRVALVPESTGRLAKSGVEVLVQRGAGEQANFPDEAYQSAGAKLVDDAPTLYGQADVVLKVRKPSLEETALFTPGSTLIGLLQPSVSRDLLARLAERNITALSLELVPRITRAQSMDVLSSQSTVAGYKAVLVGAAELAKFLPMLTTAAGSITPARVFIIGAGVAGLQAIATARRLGAVVSAFDVRAAVREQVQSLGAAFVAADVASESAEDRGGYARQQSEDEAQRTLAAIARHIKDQDLAISTALIPGKPAPRLITEEMVRSMQPGSVVVDLAAEAGGNCVLTRPDEVVRVHGVTIMGPVNLPATVPFHASQMLSKNLLTLLQHLIKDGKLSLDSDDEIVKAMVVVRDGSIRT